MTPLPPRPATPVLAAAALLATLLTAAPSGSGGQDAQVTFRSGASAIVVDVAVRDRSRRAITGLKAQDFQVLDNGVPQQVTDVTYGKLPIDVTVALDVSYSVAGNLLDSLRRSVMDLVGDLGGEDRLKLVLFNMRVGRTIDFTRDARVVERAMKAAVGGGGTSLLDALSVSLVSALAPDRRQLIVVFTDGNDSTSTTSPGMLVEVARRTRGSLAFVVPSRYPPAQFSDMPGTIRPPAVGAVRPEPHPLAGLFATLAGETGGSILPISPATNLSIAFRRVLNDFRAAYVLYYTARGVESAGYHTIKVTVNRDGAVVQARRGYFSS